MAQAGPSSRNSGTRVGVDVCNSQGCICCEYIRKGADEFQSTATKRQYQITQYLTCKTPSVIYIIECKQCNVQYVGKTSTTLQRRLRAHRASIRKHQQRPVPDHFNNKEDGLDDLIVYPIEQVNGSSDTLKQRELYWIRELDTITHGLNLVPYKCGQSEFCPGRAAAVHWRWRTLLSVPGEAGACTPVGVCNNKGGHCPSHGSTVTWHGQQQLGDGEEWPVGPAQGQVEESTEPPQKGKRKPPGNDGPKSKRRKQKKKERPVFSHETEELLSTCEDALEDGKQTISQAYDKLGGITCTEQQTMQFLEYLKKKTSGLKEYNQKEKIYIGLFGKTGAGKSSLINAIVNEHQLLPAGSLHACTSVFVQVQCNTESDEYKADIEFISPEDWKSELQFLVELLENENDQQKPATDDDMVNIAREKITAIYGEEGLEKKYSELVGPKEFPEIPRAGKKTMNFDTAKELSQNIGCYIRSDKIKKQQFWPLVKRVTISLPRSPALLERIVLVDLPGAGDVSKHRSEMWKECLSQCSSVWIVNEINRALSEKVADEIFDESLRNVAGGGECHNITFICTKTDIINPEEIKENYHLTDEDLVIEGDSEDSQYERRERQACILFRNERCKEEVSAVLKEKTKKFLFGDEGHSDGFFDVYTVSSAEFRRVEHGKSADLDRNETELPSLMEHIKKLYVSHCVKEVKDYVSEISGIISYLHFSKDALSSKAQASNSQEFCRLENELDKSCTTLDSTLSKAKTRLQECLLKGAKTAEKDSLKNATLKVLEPRWCDNRGHHKTLKALCRNDGSYRSSNGTIVDLNYSLSEPMYKQMNDVFLTTFGAGGSRTSINGHFGSFQENFITNDLLKYNRTRNNEKYLRLVYIRTEQRKLLRNLEKEILKRKKLIYNSLSDSIHDIMMPAYQECTGIQGSFALSNIKETLENAIKNSKNAMFREATKKMLDEFSDLQKYLVTEMNTQMKTALRLGLSQIPEDLTGLPDISEEKETMERCCEALGLQVF